MRYRGYGFGRGRDQEWLDVLEHCSPRGLGAGANVTQVVGAPLPPDVRATALADALGGPQAFPWQIALLDRLMAGDCPRSLDIPTGLGKTAVIAIWLVARACGATLPRRLVYVVDRRAVVDQATSVAEALREWVERSPSVKGALQLTQGQRLAISTLRGQFADNREWLSDPSAPAIVVGTVDMVGSRLLFEGYGVSRKMRPYHAGMLGADTLLVLDEAHLVPPFESLLESISGDNEAFGVRDASLRAIVPPLLLLSLSATGRATKATFTLTSDDEQHPVVRRRLDATKELLVRRPIDTEEAPLAAALAEEAWKLTGSATDPFRCIVFCNSRDDAQKVSDDLRARATRSSATIEVELFVGGRRVHEREIAAKWLQQRGFLAGHEAKPDRATFLIATSAGEVGVDLDADHMVADVVAWERMVQRLGRVNRRGGGEARVIVVPTQPNKKQKQALEKAAEDRGPDERVIVASQRMVASCLRAIDSLPRLGDARDASPGALRQLKLQAGVSPDLTALLEQASTPPPLRPALSRAVVEAWSMTSLEQHSGRPEVGPWIRGWVDQDPQTTIVWRRHLPVGNDGAPLGKNDVAAYFEAAPPHLLETIEIETYRALEWLIEQLEGLPQVQAPPPIEDAGAAEGNSPPPPALTRGAAVGFIRRPDGELRSIRGNVLEDHARGEKFARDDLERMLMGATLVVDARLGGLSTSGLLSSTSTPAQDVSDERADLPYRIRAVPPSAVDATGWFEELRLVTDSTEDGDPTSWLLIERRTARDASTEEGRSTSCAQLLDEHQSWAEREARRIACQVNLPEPYTLMLATAARLHDEGKRAPRWQRAFNAPKDGVYGKTTSRPNIALLDRYRHELGSLPRAAADAQVQALDDDLRELCLHLIAAHHGFARPVIRTDGCEDAPPSVLVQRAREVAFRFSRLEARWGPWGLAWWEALLRAADQEASRKNDERGIDHG